MRSANLPGLQEFLREYPEMSLLPTRGSETILEGKFAFTAKSQKGPLVADCYQLRIVVTAAFPKRLPEVTELEQKIPRDGKFHINQTDDTLCLGSPLRLLNMLSRKPSLMEFTVHCLIPFLYAVSLKLQGGASFLLGELAHGHLGVIDDYLELFGFNDREQVTYALELLGKRSGVADKLPCPCGCGRRLEACTFKQVLDEYRNVANRSWLKKHARSMATAS